MLGLLLVVFLLSLGAGISVGGDGKRRLFDDSGMNGGSNAVDDHGWFTGGGNPGKRNSEEFGEGKRCLNLFTDGCSSGNGPGMIGDENAAGQVGKREADLIRFIGGRNHGDGNLDESRNGRMCLFGNCGMPNGQGANGDEASKGGAGKREADLMQNPELYNLFAYWYYNKKLEENNRRLGNVGVPDERTLYGFPH